MASLSSQLYQRQGDKTIVTNEELCTLIKAGDNGYLPQLWEQVRRFIASRAARYLTAMPYHHGAELEDLIQSGYFAVLQAVKYYDTEKDFKFLTFLNQTIKTAFSETTGTRSRKRNPLNNSVSLDEPFAGNEDFTRLSTLSDSTTLQLEEIAIEDEYTRQLRGTLEQALSILSDDTKELLELHYYFGVNLRQIAGLRGISAAALAQREYDAFSAIRRSNCGKKLLTFLHWYSDNPYSGTGYCSWKKGGMSVAERFLLESIE